MTLIEGIEKRHEINDELTLVDLVNEDGVYTHIMNPKDFCIERHKQPKIKYLTIDKGTSFFMDDEEHNRIAAELIRQSALDSFGDLTYYQVMKFEGDRSNFEYRSFSEIPMTQQKLNKRLENLTFGNYYFPFSKANKDEKREMSAAINLLLIPALGGVVSVSGHKNPLIAFAAGAIGIGGLIEYNRFYNRSIIKNKLKELENVRNVLDTFNANVGQAMLNPIYYGEARHEHDKTLRLAAQNKENHMGVNYDALNAKLLQMYGVQ